MTKLTEEPCDCDVGECKGARVLYCIDERERAAASAAPRADSAERTAGESPVRAALEASMEANGANRQQAFFREAAARLATPAPAGVAAGQAGDAGAETDALVDRFAAALKVKLRAAEAKYGWKNGWLKSDWQVECQNGLLRHVGKGDPLDVAAYAAFCWHHGWPSASRRSTDFVTGAVIPTAGAIAAYETRYPEGSLSETSDNAIEAWNRVAAAVLLADKPAPDSTRTGQVGTEELREEVAYWRRDLSARLWSMTAHYKAALERGEGDRAADLANALRSALASYHDAEAGEWHDRCELCGEFVRDGEARAAWEDVSGHARCLSEDEKGHVDPHGDEDLAQRAEEAQAALDAPWPEAALAARPAAPKARGAVRQPIETAPKDRSEILLFGTLARSRGKPSWFIGAWFPTGEHGDGWWVSSCVEVIATEWAPLPAPPTSSGQEGV